MFKGADVNATTGTGDTPLSFACENGHTDVADILLEIGAELVGYSLCHNRMVLCCIHPYGHILYLLGKRRLS